MGVLSGCVSGLGSVLKCYVCGKPGIVAITGISERFQRGSRTLIYCDGDARRQVRLFRSFARAEIRDHPEPAHEALDIVRAIEEVIGPVEEGAAGDADQCGPNPAG